MLLTCSVPETTACCSASAVALMRPAEEKVAPDTASTSSVWPEMIVSSSVLAWLKNCGESLSLSTLIFVTFPPETVTDTVVVPL